MLRDCIQAVKVKRILLNKVQYPQPLRPAIGVFIYFSKLPNSAILHLNNLTDEPISRLLSRTIKIILYKTLIRPVVSYGAEVWTLTEKEEKAVLIFERKIFGRIYGPKYENGEWKSRTNRELEEMSKGENIVRRIKGQRISWLGHLERMGEDRDAQKDLHSRTGRDEKKRKTQERMERGSRKRSSSAGSEKMERVGGR